MQSAIKASLALLLLAGLANPAHALTCAAIGYDTLAGLTCSTALSAVLPGTYTVATLPPAASNQAKYAFVTDLGGGADMVLSDGVNWKHIRPGVLTNVTASANVTVTPLSSPTQMLMTGSLVTTLNVNVSATNLYPGYAVHIVIPAGVLATAASAGVSVGNNAQVIPLLGGSWADYQWNGTTLVKTAGGTL